MGQRLQGVLPAQPAISPLWQRTAATSGQHQEEGTGQKSGGEGRDGEVKVSQWKWRKREREREQYAVSEHYYGFLVLMDREESGEVPDILRRLLDWMLSSRGSKSNMEPGSVLQTFRSSGRKGESFGKTLTMLPGCRVFKINTNVLNNTTKPETHH